MVHIGVSARSKIREKATGIRNYNLQILEQQNLQILLSNESCMTQV